MKRRHCRCHVFTYKLSCARLIASSAQVWSVFPLNWQKGWCPFHVILSALCEKVTRRALCSIGNPKHTASHGNTRDLVHVQFTKEGLYSILYIYFCFSECTGCAEVALRAHAWARAHTPYVHFPPTHLRDRAVTGALWQRQCDSMWFIVSEESIKEANWGVSEGSKVCRCQRNFGRDEFIHGWVTLTCQGQKPYN